MLEVTPEDETALRWLTERANNYHNRKTGHSYYADTVLSRKFGKGIEDAQRRIARLEELGMLKVTEKRIAGQWTVAI